MRSFILFAALVLAPGCQREPSPTPTPVASPAEASPGVGSSPFRGRLEAALRISSIEARDDALRKVAIDAAEGGNAPIVKQAIQGISTVSTKDQAASESALALAKNMQTEAASEIAQCISSADMRDRTLSAIAKGQ